MTENDHDDEAMLVELGRRARERWERETSSMLDASEESPLSSEDLAEITDAVVRHTAPRPRRLARVVTVSVVASLAAVALAWLALGGPHEPVPYSGTFEGGEQQTRSASSRSDDAIPRLRSRSRFRWTLVPKTAVDDPVDVRIEATRSEDTVCLEVPAALRRLHPRGGVEIEAEVGAVLQLPSGHWTLRAIVGPETAFDDRDSCSPSASRVLADTRTVELLD